MPKATSSAASRQARRHNPLTDDILATGPLKTKAPKNKNRGNDEDAGEAEKFIDSKQSRKILSLGQDLADEERAEHQANEPNKAFAFDTRFGGDESDEEAQIEENDDAWGDEEEEVEQVEIDPEDLEMFNKFMPSGAQDPIFGNEDEQQAQGPGTNLTELILEKIAAHEAAQAGHPVIHGGGAPEDAIQIPAKVVEVYTKIGLILSRYRSGKLPKPFKILPTIPNWEDILYITRPESWTPNACYEATRIFVSSKPATVQRFMEAVILERVRDDIHETKKLNVHLFNALKKALYKPAAFFKGFLFPLVGSGTCTLREAHIVASVLGRVSIPVLHSAAALLRLCDIAAEQTSLSSEGGGATNIFIRVLLEKKYALPYKVIDALVFHFLRFRATDPTAANGDMSMSGTGAGAAGGKDVRLPVLWHQCLLAFAQRYRNDITEDQRESLLDLLLVRGHKDIGPEVRRELLEGRGRGVPIEEPTDNGGDDTMMIG
ncbi:Bystin-domain-containing protein [Xylona heveae TC161]|uniref:Bystin-domain-containing protein n=1 Tax=Xylona heveae (strain CBS 132557 / TC161) TaxID=1328760 RepID=A0A165FQJ3_XYLHT|nr:Bystin-domain-containing protein [Xylona heveae TC161]KZF21258.1 Bystin-domain-containing protein [Xylona heveae TC161]